MLFGTFLNPRPSVINVNVVFWQLATSMRSYWVIFHSTPISKTIFILFKCGIKSLGTKNFMIHMKRFLMRMEIKNKQIREKSYHALLLQTQSRILDYHKFIQVNMYDLYVFLTGWVDSWDGTLSLAEVEDSNSEANTWWSAFSSSSPERRCWFWLRSWVRKASWWSVSSMRGIVLLVVVNHNIVVWQITMYKRVEYFKFQHQIS